MAEVRKECASHDRIRGEITLLVESPCSAKATGGFPDSEDAHEKPSDRVARMQAEGSGGEKEALKRLARTQSLKRELNRELRRERDRKR